MEPIVLPLKVKSENFLIIIFWLFMMVVMLVIVCMELGSEDSPLFPFSMLWAALVNLWNLLPPLLFKNIRFDRDGIVLERRWLKPWKLLYTSLQYIRGDLLVFNGYTLNLEEYENKQELWAVFQQYADTGLLSLQNNEMNKKKKRDLIVSGVVLLLAILTLVIYFIFRGHDRQLAHIYATAFIVVHMVYLVATSLIQWQRRVRQFQ